MTHYKSTCYTCKCTIHVAIITIVKQNDSEDT